MPKLDVYWSNWMLLVVVLLSFLGVTLIKNIVSGKPLKPLKVFLFVNSLIVNDLSLRYVAKKLKGNDS